MTRRTPFKKVACGPLAMIALVRKANNQRVWLSEPNTCLLGTFFGVAGYDSDIGVLPCNEASSKFEALLRIKR